VASIQLFLNINIKKFRWVTMITCCPWAQKKIEFNPTLSSTSGVQTITVHIICVKLRNFCMLVNSEWVTWYWSCSTSATQHSNNKQLYFMYSSSRTFITCDQQF
jgi:hypothetical protein